MKTTLTSRQSAILSYLRRHHAKYGAVPSMRQICSEFSIGTVNGVMAHLRALERKGRIVREQGGRAVILRPVKPTLPFAGTIS